MADVELRLLGPFEVVTDDGQPHQPRPVLVIACPHALGLAIPLVIAISTSKSARAGIPVKDRLALERMRSVDTVLFDKTGTLTRGEPAVVAVLPVDGVTDAELLGAAGAAESDSEHPLARAVVAAVRAAAGVLAGAGFVLPVAVGAVAMSVSTIVVALNAQLLRRVDLRADRASV